MIRMVRGMEASQYPDLMDRLFRLRYENFVVRRKWSLACRGNRDIDQYDNENATYFIVLDDDESRILASARIHRTEAASLLADLFPHLVENGAAPRGPNLFEGTRFTVDPSLRSRDQVRKARALLCGTACRWMMSEGGTELQAVVEMSAFPSFLAMSLTTQPLGLAHEYGGGPRVSGGGRCIAFRWHLTPRLLDDFEVYACGAEAQPNCAYAASR